GRADDAVGRDLVARADLDEVVEDDVVDDDFLLVAVAYDSHTWFAEHGEPVEGALGPDLLDDSDERVADQDEAEQGVLRLPDQQDDDEQRPQDRVEAGEDVRPQDLAVGPAGALGGGVRLPPPGAGPGPGLGEPRRRGLVRRCGRNRLARTRRRGHDGEASPGGKRMSADGLEDERSYPTESGEEVGLPTPVGIAGAVLDTIASWLAPSRQTRVVKVPDFRGLHVSETFLRALQA